MSRAELNTTPQCPACRDRVEVCGILVYKRGLCPRHRAIWNEEDRKDTERGVRGHVADVVVVDDPLPPNCPLRTGARPCMCDLPRCPECGYTKHDAQFECDHARCGGTIPPAKPVGEIFGVPLVECDQCSALVPVDAYNPDSAVLCERCEATMRGHARLERDVREQR